MGAKTFFKIPSEIPWLREFVCTFEVLRERHQVIATYRHSIA